MGTPEEGRPRPSALSVITVEARDIVIILAAFVVLAVLGIFVVQHYSRAEDAAAVLGVVIPAISTIAGTAFGVSAGVRAGAAVGSATAEAARNETEAVRTEAAEMRAQTKDAFTDVTALKTQLEPVIQAAGTSRAQLPADQLEEARTKLASAEESLKAAL
jgi:hypothetical protein